MPSMSGLEAALVSVSRYLERVRTLQTRYRAGEIHVRVPELLKESDRPLDELIGTCFPTSYAALSEAALGLFYSLPVAFDPGESVGPFLATADRDASGEPYRFLDLGALIATHAFGENEPAVIEGILRELPSVVSRYAHSEYQTLLSLRMKATLSRLAPRGTPRHFVVNTGAEAVENAIKAVLLGRVRTAGDKEDTFVVSFDGAFHGRTIGSLAVTHRKKARLGFPTFRWPKVSFPAEDPSSPAETARREERSLRQLWEVLLTGRAAGVPKARETFRRELEAIDGVLAACAADPSGGDRLAALVDAERARIGPEALARAHRAAAVLIEPIQGEGGIRLATPRFFRRLRVLTRIYDVPLVLDEIQSGGGATGRMWAHELFELPAPPDVVVWAKKFQNGVLFASEELATFFQEEKKFNTTWEGDSTGMARVLATVDRIDLEQVRRTGHLALDGLRALERKYSDFIQHVRGYGVMLAFDVVRADWRDVLRDRAFRLGLILLPAGERTLRVYPRYDMEPYSIAEAFEILERAIDDVLEGRAAREAALGPRLRVGTLDCPLGLLETLDLSPATFEQHRAGIIAVEAERYGAESHYPRDVLRRGRRPLLQFPPEVLEATIANPRSAGIAVRDAVSGRIVAYALGSPIENHDELGVQADPHLGDHNTFYLQAMASLPSIRNQTEVEYHLLGALRRRVLELGYEFISCLIEEQLLESGPPWLRAAVVLSSADNYLGSGVRFVYLQASLGSSPSEPARS